MKLEEEIKLLERKVELLKELKELQDGGEKIVYVYPVCPSYPTSPWYPTPYTSPWCGSGRTGQATGGS
jgi:hypothetical protein